MFTLQTTIITKYSRINNQEVQSSRSFQPSKMHSIHHEVLTNLPAVHPSRSTHELLLLMLLFVVVVCPSITKSHNPRLAINCPSITKYSRVAVVRQEAAEAGLYWWKQLNLLRTCVFLAETWSNGKHRPKAQTREANKPKSSTCALVHVSTTMLAFLRRQSHTNRSCQ